MGEQRTAELLPGGVVVIARPIAALPAAEADAALGACASSGHRGHRPTLAQICLLHKRQHQVIKLGMTSVTAIMHARHNCGCIRSIRGTDGVLLLIEAFLGVKVRVKVMLRL